MDVEDTFSGTSTKTMFCLNALNALQLESCYKDEISISFDTSQQDKDYIDVLRDFRNKKFSDDEKRCMFEKIHLIMEYNGKYFQRKPDDTDWDFLERFDALFAPLMTSRRYMNEIFRKFGKRLRKYKTPAARFIDPMYPFFKDFEFMMSHYKRYVMTRRVSAMLEVNDKLLSESLCRLICEFASERL